MYEERNCDTAREMCALGLKPQFTPIDIRKAQNGYIVSTMGKQYIAQSVDETITIVSDLMKKTEEK